MLNLLDWLRERNNMYENPADALEKISRYMNLNDLPDMRDNSLICCEERRNANQNPCNTCVNSEICAYREIVMILKR